MNIRQRDRNSFSFGRLSDPQVLEKSPLYGSEPALEHFTDGNFQYIVNHIADMFGYAHNCISARVDGNDVAARWEDKNGNQQVEEDELSFHFVMNAQMNIYERASIYGRNFMYLYAKQYGYPLIFGVAAHEVGHLVAHQATDVLESRLLGGRPALTVTGMLHPYWDELCADYLSGIVLSKANPPMDPNPQIEFLSAAKAGPEHPDGYLRRLAFETGYQWGKNNPPAQTSAIISRIDSLRQLLQSFCTGYYSNVYMRIGDIMRRYLPLPQEYMQKTNLPLGYL